MQSTRAEAYLARPLGMLPRFHPRSSLPLPFGLPQLDPFPLPAGCPAPAPRASSPASQTALSVTWKPAFFQSCVSFSGPLSANGISCTAALSSMQCCTHS
eukprot:EG_transcript_18770